MAKCLCTVSFVYIAIVTKLRVILTTSDLHRPEKHFIIDAAADNNISDVRPIFDSLDWSEDSYRNYERIGQTGEQFHMCLSVTEEVGIVIQYIFVFLLRVVMVHRILSCI